MQQSQKLKAIDYLFNSNKEKELSYTKKYKLVWEDKISDKHYSVIRDKYIWFDILEWVDIYNHIWYSFNFRNIYYWLNKVNFYKKSIINDSRWWDIRNWTKLLTIFNIKDSKIFLNSILDFIDKEKENLAVLNKQEQIKELKKEIDKSKGKFERFKLPLTFNLSKYLSSYTQYYKTLKLLENQYNIENIQIYQWKITFTLSENKEKETLVEFDWKEIFIEKNPIYFKEMKNWNTTNDLFVLLFSYFKKNWVNKVDFDSLEKYYKENQELYKWLKTTKFFDEWVRGYIKEKNKKIELDKFLEVTTTWIECQYYHPER